MGMFTRRRSLLALIGFLLGGCATRHPKTFGSITTRGVKPPHRVAPCCRPLAEGKITLAECMQNPACKANNNVCCMRAIEDLP